MRAVINIGRSLKTTGTMGEDIIIFIQFHIYGENDTHAHNGADS